MIQFGAAHLRVDDYRSRQQKKHAPKGETTETIVGHAFKAVRAEAEGLPDSVDVLYGIYPVTHHNDKDGRIGQETLRLRGRNNDTETFDVSIARKPDWSVETFVRKGLRLAQAFVEELEIRN